MEAGATIRLAELGPLSVAVDGGPLVAVRGDRAVRVLAVLALRGRSGMTSDELVETCWPSDQPATARRSLANVIRRLRTRLGPDAIVTAGSTYRLDGALDSDRATLLASVGPARDALDAGDAAEARRRVGEGLAGWRGEPWTDLDDLDQVVADRLVIHEAHRELLAVRAAAARVASDFVLAIACWQDLLALDPFRERAWIELARVTAEAQGRREALRVLQRARRSLAEVGLDASPALIATEQAIADPPDRRVGSPTTRRVPIVDSLTDHSLPFVGRRSEMAALDQVIDRVAAGGVGAAFLAGVPGSGKTRLASELLARRSGARGASGSSAPGARPAVEFLVGQCVDGIDSPLGPFAAILRHSGLDATEPGLATVRRYGAAGVESASGSQGGADQGRQRRAHALSVAELVADRAHDHPVVLVLDDLHWASDLVLDIVEMVLVGSVPASGVGIVATYRTNPPDLAGDVEARIAELAARDAVVEIAVGALAVDDVETLAASTDIAASPAELHRHTGGNAFFLTETLKSGQLARPGPHLERLVAARLGALHPEAGAFLTAGAALGLEFPIGPAADAAGLTGPELDRLVGDLHRAGLLVETDRMAARSRFTHALVAEAVTAGLGTREQQRLRLALARSLERRGHPITEWVESLLRAGPLVDHGTAAAAAHAAAGRFVAAGNDEAAATVLGILLERSLPPDHARPALNARALSLMRLGRHVDGRVLARRSAESAIVDGDGVALAEAAMTYSHGGAWSDNVDDVGPDLLRRALTLLDPDELVLQARVTARLSGWSIFTASLDDRDAATADALVQARRSGSTVALVDALNARQIAIACPVRARESLALDDELGALARVGMGRSELSSDPTPATYWLADGARYRREVATRVADHEPALPDLVASSLAGVVALHDGDLDAARAHQREIFARRSNDVDWGNAVWQAVAVAWLAGDPTTARTVVEDATAALRGLPLRLTAAWLRAEAGDVDEARQVVDKIRPHRFATLGELFLGGFALGGAAMAAARLDDRALAGLVRPPLEAVSDQMLGVPWASYPSAAFFLGVLAVVEDDAAGARHWFERARETHARMHASAFDDLIERVAQ